MSIPGQGPEHGTRVRVESPQEKAQRIFREIMDEVQKNLGFSINNPPLLEHDPKYGIMVLFDDILQRISSFTNAYFIMKKAPRTNRSKIAQEFPGLKSEIAVCVAFLCHACEHQEVGAAVKEDLGGRQDLKPAIQRIIRFFGENNNFNDPNVEKITIDNSYRVVIQLRSNSKKKKYQLNW
jgi:hypothetical protein